ncbi:MAG: ribonuclease D [Alphaproteobacteria bacterium]|nr:ribonuclease D [Alphaproteobacteria bacterium]
MNVIEKNEELIEFCRRLKNKEFITVDLEFLREKTYYAKLCLIQVGSVEECAIIDPLAEGINLQPFFDIMSDKKIVKVFHSCRQDVEIIHNLTNKIPEPIFDTQIAAMVCGYGESVSYETLVNKIVKQELDKTSRLSNWGKRPLDEKQLKYALSDVTHLRDIYLNLKENLEKNNSLHWLDEEMEILKTPETYFVDPYDVWQKIKHRSHNVKFLTLLRELAAWREKRSQRKNTLRQSVIKDEVLLSIAAISPTSHEELAEIRNIRKDVLSGKLADEIIEVVKAFKEIKPEDYVKLPKEKNNNSFSAALYELLKMLLKIVSQEKGVVAKLIASDDDLRDFASFRDENNPILKGWRLKIFGTDALELREGKIYIKYNNAKKTIDLIKTEPEPKKEEKK